MNKPILILSVAGLLSLNSQASSAYVISESKWKVGEYTFVKKEFNWKGEDARSLEVFRRGRSVLRRQAHDVWVWTLKNNEFVETETGDRLELVDLNGDGVRDFVVRQWSGGAYCCYTYEVFSLKGDCPRLFYNDAKCAHLKILRPKNSCPILAMEDGSFLYWRTHTLNGPRPIVHLHWKNGFVIDRKRMLKPADTNRFNKIQEQPWSDETESLFIDLIYTGHIQDALKLLNKLSPKERTEFAKSFWDAFKKSPFFYKVVAINDHRAISRLKETAH